MYCVRIQLQRRTDGLLSDDQMAQRKKRIIARSRIVITLMMQRSFFISRRPGRYPLCHGPIQQRDGIPLEGDRSVLLLLKDGCKGVVQSHRENEKISQVGENCWKEPDEDGIIKKRRAAI